MTIIMRKELCSGCSLLSSTAWPWPSLILTSIAPSPLFQTLLIIHGPHTHTHIHAHNVYMSIPVSQFIPLNPYPLVTIGLFSTSVTLLFLQISSFVSFSQIPHISSCMPPSSLKKAVSIDSLLTFFVWLLIFFSEWKTIAYFLQLHNDF